MWISCDAVLRIFNSHACLAVTIVCLCQGYHVCRNWMLLPVQLTFHSNFSNKAICAAKASIKKWDRKYRVPVTQIIGMYGMINAVALTQLLFKISIWQKNVHIMSFDLFVKWLNINIPGLVQIMACHLDSARPLSEPVLKYCWLDPYEQTSVKF